MQKIKFINRKRELRFLDNMYSKTGGLVVIYGRRRVGKTELIKQFITGKKHLYYLADKRGTQINAKNMTRLGAEVFDELPVEVSNFDDVFKFISKRMNEKIVVVIDEFSYLVEKDSTIPSVFQLIVDEIIKEKEILLILSGSNISMMHNGTLSYKSPLYGRRIGEWNLKPLNFKELTGFFPGMNIEKAIELYSIFGNIPAYLDKIDTSKTVKENILNVLMRKGSGLYREPEFLLKKVLREPSRYISIFEALGSSAKLSEIASKSNVPAKDLPKYFKVLSELELIRKEIPITDAGSKMSHYYINDNLFYFYFKFLYQYISLLEIGEEEDVYTKIKPSFQLIFSKAFEDITREFILTLPDFSVMNTGRWWGYTKEKGTRIEKEIDVIALNDRDNSIVFVECKYSFLNYKKALRVILDLKKKSEFVKWHNQQRNEIFGIAAKKIEGKEKLREAGYIAMDFYDFEKIIRNRTQEKEVPILP